MIIGASFACVPPLVFWLSGTAITGLNVGMVIGMVTLQIQLTEPIQALLQLSSGFHVSLAEFERVIEYLDSCRRGSRTVSCGLMSMSPFIAALMASMSRVGRSVRG
jgi:hypothetical protein